MASPVAPEPCMPERPGRRVGTRLLFENDRVRVWEMRLAPGEASERHLHDSDYLFVYLAPAQLTLVPDGGPPQTSQASPGAVHYTEVGGGIVHRLVNTGETEHHEVLVELKGASRSRDVKDESNGAG